jgi:NTP pyrophosphatase (non-canonical NTP hydrolase)
MTLEEIVQQCIEDSSEWFPKASHDLSFLALCLGGETGEFQNKVKKVWRGSASLAEMYPGLKDEAIDIFIYLCNIAAVLDFDLEEEYRAKRAFNQQRFGSATTT